MGDLRRGIGFGIATYVLWGLLPLYWPLLDSAGSVEILAHRIIWSLVAAVAILTAMRHWSWIKVFARQPKRLGLLALGAIIVSCNWVTYIYAVNSDHTIEASLGYFINPLLSIVLGVLVFKERLRGWQWTAVGLGTVAIVVLTVDYGQLPWISLVLAVTFATYAVIKKIVAVGSAEGLMIETLVMLLPSLVYVLTLQAGGDGSFGGSLGLSLLLATAGLATAAPLLLFNAAAIRIPLSYIGMLQYIAPVMQFLIGWQVQGEDMPASRWIGFLLVWSALMVLTTDSLATRRNSGTRPPEFLRAA